MLDNCINVKKDMLMVRFNFGVRTTGANIGKLEACWIEAAWDCALERIMTFCMWMCCHSSLTETASGSRAVVDRRNSFGKHWFSPPERISTADRTVPSEIHLIQDHYVLCRRFLDEYLRRNWHVSSRQSAAHWPDQDSGGCAWSWNGALSAVHRNAAGPLMTIEFPEKSRLSLVLQRYS